MASSQNTSFAIGIDLGTTYCSIAVLKEHGGTPTVFRNDVGEDSTPCYVSYLRDDEEDEDPVVGLIAKNLTYINPQKTVYNILRLIGRQFDDPYIQSCMKVLPFQLVNIRGFVGVKIGEKELLPHDIVKELLLYLRRTAEYYLQCEVHSAVVSASVPFNGFQLGLIREACASAGLNEVEFITASAATAVAYRNELTAAAIPVNTCLIIDLGGGSLDLAIFSLDSQNRVEIKAVGGDDSLGGEDFTNILTEYCIADFKNKHGIDLLEGKSSANHLASFKAARNWHKVRNECERKKVYLSQVTKVVIAIDCLHGDIDMVVKVTREVFEDLIRDLLETFVKTLDNFMNSNSIEVQDIAEVLLTGGSSRIPKVQELAYGYFQGKKPFRRSLVSDMAVARGASIQAFYHFHGKHMASPSIELGIFSEATSLGHIKEIRYEVRKSSSGIVYNVIHPLQKFINQSDCVQQLKDAITQPESSNETQLHPTVLSRACILYGKRGSGKTETVRKYIQQYRNIYENIVWVDALNQSTAEESLRGLAKDLRIPGSDISITSSGYKTFLHAIYLELCKRRSLVVLDNADCDSKGGNEYSILSLIPDALPRTCISLTIIIIARNQIFDQRAICPSIWTDQDATNFFKEELSLYKERALKLPKELIFLPSFLAQAVCLIRNNCYVGVTITLEDALVKFFNEYSEFFIATSSSKTAKKTENKYSENTVWEMTLNRVRNTDNGKLAIKILNFLVYLNYGHIPWQLIPEIFHEELEANRDRALSLLVKYNLCVDYGNYLGVPRIARDYVAEQLKVTNQEMRVLEALVIIFTKLLASDYKNHDDYSSLLHNAQYVVMEHLTDQLDHNHYGRFARSVALGIQRIEPTSSLKILKILHDADQRHGCLSVQLGMSIGNGLASILNLKDLPNDSFLVSDLLLRTYATKPGLDPNLVVECKLLQAEALDLMGRTLDAFSQYKNILNGSSRVLGIHELHDSVYMSVEPNRLIQTYFQILELQKRTFRNPHHPIILRLKKRLASCLCSTWRHTLANTLYTEVLKAQDNFANYYLPDTLETMQNLAEALNAHDNHAEALAIFNKILKHQENMLNPKNPNVLQTRKKVAVTLCFQEKFEEAIQIYKQVLELEEKDLGSEHPVVLVTKRHLAETLVSSGKVADGFTMLLDVVKVEENILGKDHPNVLITKKCIEHAIRKN